MSPAQEIAEKRMSIPHASGVESRRLIVLRICVLISALLIATAHVYLGSGWSDHLRNCYAVLGLLLGFSALSGVWFRSRGAGSIFVQLQYIADTLIVTGVVYITGGPISPLLFLYLALAIVAAIVSSRRTALIVCVWCVVAYSALVAALMRGWIQPSDGGAIVQLPQHGLLLQGIGLSSAMVLIAIGTTFLRRRLQVSEAFAEKSLRDLSDLHARQKILFDELPAGVVTTSREGRIIGVNQKATELLGITDEPSRGRPFNELFRSLFPGTSLPKAHEVSEGQQVELEIVNTQGAEVRVAYLARSMPEEHGGQGGTMHIFQDVTKLRSVEGQLELQERMAQLLASKHPPVSESSTRLNGFVGESPVMKKVFALIERISRADASVLITGESGTGKELVARAIHLGGDRARAPFVAINCGAVPENLIESQLFGHKKGSFTSADSDQSGLFQQAERGTLFLDEIGELPLHMQAKLLRALQEKTIRPIGGDRDIPIDVRIISATNRNLRREVEDQRFREDLYYRLHVIGINLPPLRDRKDDIPLLVNAFLRRFMPGENRSMVSPKAMELLMSYAYPGNVRELENIIERALVLGGEVVLPEHLPDYVQHQVRHSPSDAKPETVILIDENIQLPIDLDMLLANIERKYLETALVQTRGVKKRAADLLGMNFRSFRYRLQKFGLSD